MTDEIEALERALRGLDYPAPRNKLVAMALENGAPAAVIDRIRQLPETADIRSREQLREMLGVDVRGETPRAWE